MKIDVPALCLVVLVGASGSGKSTFARKHFLGTEVISSDFCRGLVSDDENDQSASKDAFEVLNFIAGKRLAAGRLTVVDATNVQPDARKELVNLAREYDVLPVAIVLDPPERVCVERNEQRADRQFGAKVVTRQRSQLKRGLRSLKREGFRTVHVLDSVEQIDAVSIERTRLYNDLTDRNGPFDIIGDVHGCRPELERLLTDLGYTLTRDDAGRPINAVHPERRAIFVGDLVDRGPDSPGVLRLVMGMVAGGNAYCVPGNHEDKLLRALRGKNVKVSHGLETTLEQLAAESAEFRDQVAAFIDGLISHYVFDDGRLVVSHAGLVERMHGRTSGRVRSFCLYGETTGETDEFGLPVRYPWANDYRGRAMVVYGHTPTPAPEWINNTICLDTGCVFGGSLTALRYPERELVAVQAAEEYYAPAKPLHVATAPAREPDVLELTDVTGRRVIETASHGRLSIRAEQAGAALEVMSRFAIDPRFLLYLPPTMSPIATSPEPGLLEHPRQAFETYRGQGVTELVCEEKHMGSRAVVLLTRDDDVAEKRFGLAGRGAIHTRTGRSFFDAELTDELLLRLRAVAAAAGVFDELDTSWLLLDAELLPWSAKAEDLLRNQYAAVGAAARTSLPAATAALRAAAASGLDMGDLLSSAERRTANAERFTAAYRRYCWPTDGLDGVRVAPFQVLASEGATYQERPHAWHLGIADRMVAAGPELITPTRRLFVDADSWDAGIAWWEELTGAGGEGMVVKPAANLTRTAKGLAQPGLKVRGQEYLRLIYGPDYTEPANFTRLRDRNLGHKRSLALREYALGLESLDRAARGEPLWRIHECVFAVLAFESEPIDPRL
ncbi:polynucleotide kinase-phosphatase [Kribbella sindirgiensis]|uniref:Polynucleotide kinase-phosphatase n=1 Tax=Kribbella sindirgiensis TaxID=1124744 RepID=A0A4R0IJH8_9ACTN|nr:polynucleotide kinase-phosphatase [Kribbella sindirgiensis]TCC33621.1 polynucleotide kinase-phosphatase [Kribbella sindirgiensis]